MFKETIIEVFDKSILKIGTEVVSKYGLYGYIDYITPLGDLIFIKHYSNGYVETFNVTQAKRIELKMNY